MTSTNGNANLERTEAARRKWRGALFVVFLLFLAVIAWGGMRLAFASDAPQNYVQVVDGEGQKTLLPLEQDTIQTFATSLGENTLEISQGSVRMVDSNCPNQDCIDQGATSHPADMIVCMPHKLIVTIVSDEGSNS